MLKPLYACAVAESILTRPRTKKAWIPKIGGNDLELARWSSHQPVRNGTHVVLCTRTKTAMFTCGVARVVTVSLQIEVSLKSYSAISPMGRFAYVPLRLQLQRRADSPT